MNAILKSVTAPLRAALYARYSTENQRETSITDQFRECERIAAREGMEVVARFSDPRLSGGTTSRPGYQDMLTGARRHEFDVLITEDIDRLWRNRTEFGPRSAELEDLGIHWLSCIGDDTRREGWGLTIQIKAAMAEGERRKASYRTRRGLVGKALNGKSTGGKAYAYTSMADPSGERNKDGTPVMIRIQLPEQAKIVLQIFKWRAQGWSGQRIARQLNADGNAPPGASWKRKDTGPNRKNTAKGWTHSAIVGDPKRGVGILNNPLYKGHIVWARSRWIPSAQDSKNRIVKAQPDGEWIHFHDENLRIVSDELWERVHVVQTASSPRRDAVRLGIAQKKRICRSHSKYLLGSTLVCAECGSNYISDGPKDYLCPAHTVGQCSNNMRFRRDEAHQKVFAAIASQLWTPEALARGRERIEAMLRERQREEEATALRVIDGSAIQKLNEQAERTRCISEDVMPPDAKSAALAAIAKRREELLDQSTKGGGSLESRAKRLIARMPEIVSTHRKLLAEGAKALADHAVVADANETLRRLLVDGRITLAPNIDRTGVVGAVHVKELGDHLLELSGWKRNLREINNKLSGSGGSLPVLQQHRSPLWHRPCQPRKRVTSRGGTMAKNGHRRFCAFQPWVRPKGVGSLT